LTHSPENRPPKSVRPRPCRPGVEVLEGRLLLSTFVVANTNDSGPGSLRQAILDANANPGTNAIAFDVNGGGAQTIAPRTQLPDLTGPVVIDGTTQPGYAGQPLIDLSGSSLFFGGNGLTITGGGSTVRGLAINGFRGSFGFTTAGIVLSGRGGNVVAGNYIGTDRTGSTGLGNFDGVLVVGSSNNVIGGTSAADRNLIAANSQRDIDILPGSDANVVEGNYIGTDVSGVVQLSANTGVGVQSSYNTVGGTAAGAGNLIGANDGVSLFNSATGNAIQGNLIGTDATGTNALIGFRADGIQVAGCSFNLIGGAAPGARNVIAAEANGQGVVLRLAGSTGNVVAGNFIGTDVTGTKALGSRQGVLVAQGANGNVIGGAGPGAGNLISGNGDGVVVTDAGSTDNVVAGNFIGTDAFGAAALGNTGSGVSVVNTFSNVVGGAAPGAGNVISGNGGDGVLISTTSSSQALANFVLGNLIGTDATGTHALGNGTGVRVVGVASSNVVGGAAPGAGNLISGNLGDGVAILSSGVSNRVLGNYIGTDVTGTNALGNTNGVTISGGNNNLVGGAAPGAGNLISGNRQAGVLFSGSSEISSSVLGNLIGTDVTGSVALGNRFGVEVAAGARGNQIGGTDTGAGNLISGNSAFGVFLTGAGTTGNAVLGNLIGTDGTGTNALGNSTGVLIAASSNTVGGAAPGARNVISGNASEGVFVSAGSGNVVQGNYVGTDVTGTAAVANGYAGNGDGVIVSDGATNTTIGGTAAGAGNVLSGNHRYGLLLNLNTSNATVQGNYIGTDATGAAALGNGADGVFVGGAANDLIGGTAPAARNVISANGGYGVEVVGTPATGNRIQGNYVGTDATGAAALGNALDGVAVFIGLNNSVGGAAAGAGNLISGNAGRGVTVAANNTAVQGNRVGTDVTGKAGLGNGSDGVAILNASGNTVGGTAPAAANVISANGGSGVLISGANARSNLLQGNYVGTDASATVNLGNAADGVTVSGGSNNTVGGTAPGAGNVIAFNGNDGVLIDTGTGNAVLSDLIFSSGNLGIELVNGGNNNQPAPQVLSATQDGPNTVIQGFLSSTPNTAFTLQFFSDPVCDPSGQGEGQRLLGTLTVTTDAFGFASFTFTASPGVPTGQFVAATATDTNNNTSEFSACFGVTGA
jgi:titin